METRNHSSSAFVKTENKQSSEAQAQLPVSYGKTEAFLLPKDPAWMFLFWDITGTTYDYIKSQHGFDIFDKSKQVVRLHDTTGKTFDGYNSNSYTDIDVFFDAKSWYLQAPVTGHTYVADLGLVTPQGTFILMARSNPVALPTGRVSDVIDEKWMTVESNFQKIYAMSGANLIGLGASEMAHILNEKWRTIEGMPSSYASSNMSSKHIVKEDTQVQDDMWLRADCEIIIYGSASPGATVKINGKEIELNNGSFSIRQSLQKGDVVDLPITAEKNNMTRSLKIKAQRED
ncbi:hypothetical protein AAIR98_000341 [Elusimicrobium simillimum]|uniref:DUF4912 domain-containing protein n=1 Tax=Elusimicrobium simillimum TaxID=3143438 RepID=UPI003C6EEAA1